MKPWLVGALLLTAYQAVSLWNEPEQAAGFSSIGTGFFVLGYLLSGFAVGALLGWLLGLPFRQRRT